MSLVGHWRLDGDVTDSVGNNNGSGSPTYVDGKLGQGIDTTGERITVDYANGVKSALSGNQFTLSLWWRQYDYNNYRWSDIIEIDNHRLERGSGDDGNPEADFWCNFGSGNGDQLYNSSVNGVDGTEWFHTVVRRKGDDYEVWINGEVAASGTRTEDINYSGNLEFDPSPSGSEIDDIRLYDHAISKKKIKQLSQAKVLHYKFNESGSVADASGQGNDGTLNGPTFSESSKIGSGAYDFDGNNDTIDLSPKSIPTGNEITVSFWSYGGSELPVDNSILEAEDSNNNRVVNIHHPWGNGNIYWDTDNGGSGYERIYKSASSSDYKGRWSHWSFTKDADTGEKKIYLDGELWHSGSGYTGTLDVTNSAALGSYTDGSERFWPGRISDFRIYATALSASEVQEVYEQRASIDAGGSLHAHELNDGARESFETASFGPRWNVSNATISSNRSYHGNYSFGSWNDGGVEATWNVFDNERQIDSFEYLWKEDGSQTGHVVILYDGNGNQVQESGTENPQWYLNNGTGGRFPVAGYDGQGYNVWTRFRFDFDWDSGTYDYEMYDLDKNVVRTGTTDLDNVTGVQSIRFTGAGYGTADSCRFDQLKINDNTLGNTGIFNSAEPNEIGPAPESLVGWWPLDGDTKDYAGPNNGTNNGASVTSGLGQSAYDFVDSESDNIQIPEYNGFTSKTVSISVWIKPDSNHSGDTRIVYHEGNDSAMILGYGSSLSIEHRASSGGFSGAGSVDENKWNHIVFVWDDTQDMWYNYKNGQLDTSGSMGGGHFSDNLGGLDIGTGHWTSDSSYYLGKLQDIRFYDRALTEAEVAQLYAITDPREDQRVIQTEDGRAIVKEQFSELL